MQRRSNLLLMCKNNFDLSDPETSGDINTLLQLQCEQTRSISGEAKMCEIKNAASKKQKKLE